jgi:hypothetical protein
MNIQIYGDEKILAHALQSLFQVLTFELTTVLQPPRVRRAPGRRSSHLKRIRLNTLVQRNDRLS